MASSQVRFRLHTSDLLMLKKVDVGLPHGCWGVGIVKCPLYWCWFFCSDYFPKPFQSLFSNDVAPFCDCIFSVNVLIFWQYSVILRLVRKFSRVSAAMYWWFWRLEKVLLSYFATVEENKLNICSECFYFCNFLLLKMIFSLLGAVIAICKL